VTIPLPQDGDKAVKVKHDIVVMKPESAKKQTGFFKSNKSRYPMYPCHEEKIKYDDYGEIIRPEDFMDTAEPVNNLDSHVTLHQPEAEVEEEAHKEEVPTKCVSSTQNFAVNCKVQFIDFEGRTDGESIKKLLHQLKPRKVVLVRGEKHSLADLKDFCSEVVEGENNVFVPRNGEVVDATTERFIYQVRLRDSLFSTLKFSKAKDAQLAWLDGVVKMVDDERTDLKPTAEEGEEVEALKPKAVIPMLIPLAEESVKGHPTNFVNELKLSDFKLVLTRNGIPSEFQLGNLMCGNNSNVQLRRHESGRVMIEGCVSDDYYVIRELLYQQYAIV
jgi:cleavage and polyadenylation specificity factor subunit 2